MANSTENGLVRQLGIWDTSAIIIGTIIGSGIFLVPHDIALNLSSPWVILLTWILGGFMALLGAFIFAELSSFMPATGGIYVFLKDAFGPLISFLFGWLYVLAIKPAAVATICTGVAIYLAQLIPLSSLGVKAAAIILILILSSIHYRGVRLGSNVMNFLTALKLLLIAVFILLGLSSGQTDWSALFSGTGSGFNLQILSSVGVALALILWAYDGWADISYIAGEVKNPGRTLPVAIITSTIVVIAIYIAMNIIFIITVPLDLMAEVEQVGSESARVLFGPAGAVLVTVAIIISITGSANGSTMYGPRVYFKMGRDGYFFRWTGRVHPRFKTPANAVVAQGVFAVLLTASGKFDQLANLFIFTTWLFYVLSAVALFVFRRRYPERKRPFSAWGYPVTPGLFILIGLAMIINTVFQYPTFSGYGIGVLLLGIPIYLLFFRKREKQPSVESKDIGEE